MQMWGACVTGVVGGMIFLAIHLILPKLRGNPLYINIYLLSIQPLLYQVIHIHLKLLFCLSCIRCIWRWHFLGLASFEEFCIISKEIFNGFLILYTKTLQKRRGPSRVSFIANTIFIITGNFSVMIVSWEITCYFSWWWQKPVIANSLSQHKCTLILL